MPKRKSLSRKQRAAMFEKSGGTCCLCSLPIDPEGRWRAEHVKPLWLGGTNAKRNLGPAHVACAIAKDKREAPVRAKMKRQRKKNRGWRKPQLRPMIGTIASGWKRRFDGTLERR